MTFSVSEAESVQAFGLASAAVCIGVGGVAAALGEGLIASVAARGTARQPAGSGGIVQTMLLGQAMAESAAIFSLVIALLLAFNYDRTPAPGTWLVYAACYLGAAVAVAIAAIGCSWGAAIPALDAVEGAARRPSAAQTLTAPLLLGAAVAQSTVIYGFVVSLILIFLAPGPGGIARVSALFTAGLCVGLGAVGPAVGEGQVAGVACRAIARKPGISGIAVRTMLLGQAVTETTGIYALVISLILIFVA